MYSILYGLDPWLARWVRHTSLYTGLIHISENIPDGSWRCPIPNPWWQLMLSHPQSLMAAGVVPSPIPDGSWCCSIPNPWWQLTLFHPQSLMAAVELYAWEGQQFLMTMSCEFEFLLFGASPPNPPNPQPCFELINLNYPQYPCSPINRAPLRWHYAQSPDYKWSVQLFILFCWMLSRFLFY